MKTKVCAVAIALMMTIALLGGCAGNTPAPTSSPSGPTTLGPTATPMPTAAASPSPAANATIGPSASPSTDTVSSASITSDPAVFKKALSKTGTWIICATADLTFTEELMLEGEFKNGKKDDKGNDVIQRKIALYTQDENRTVTARFTLKAPKLTITSPNASIQHGTFVGDLYVNVDNFQLVDNKVEGNIYFGSDKNKSTFKMDEKSSVTGKQEVKK